jgi:hypothetical protein
LPTLQIETVRSARRPKSTGPKCPLPVMASFPLGVSPETAIVLGPPGSSLETVRVADLAPKLVGWKRTSTSWESPGATTIG